MNLYKNARGKLVETKVPQAKLTPEDVREIRRIYRSGEMNQPELAKKYGVGTATVNRLISRETWRHLE